MGRCNKGLKAPSLLWDAFFRLRPWRQAIRSPVFRLPVIRSTRNRSGLRSGPSPIPSPGPEPDSAGDHQRLSLIRRSPGSRNRELFWAHLIPINRVRNYFYLYFSLFSIYHNDSPKALSRPVGFFPERTALKIRPGPLGILQPKTGSISAELFLGTQKRSSVPFSAVRNPGAHGRSVSPGSP